MKNLVNKYNILIIIVISLFLNSCGNPTYCECDEQISEALSAAIGIPGNPDFGTVEDCNEMVKRDLNLNVRASKMSLDFSSQVAYQMCKNGYYEGMHADDKGKKYYPKE